MSTYTYDNNGNLTLENVGGAITTNQFDRENRLSSVNASGSLETYTYSGDGLRRTKNDGVVTTFIWDGNDYLMEKD